MAHKHILRRSQKPNLEPAPVKLLGFYVYAAVERRTKRVIYVDWGGADDYLDWVSDDSKRHLIQEVRSRKEQVEYYFLAKHFDDMGDAIRGAALQKSKLQGSDNHLSPSPWLSIRDLDRKFLGVAPTPTVNKRILAVPLWNSWSPLMSQEQILELINKPWRLSKKAAQNAEVIFAVSGGVIRGVFEILSSTWDRYSGSYGTWKFVAKPSTAPELNELIDTRIVVSAFRRRSLKYLEGYMFKDSDLN